MKKVLLLCVAAAFLAIPSSAHDGLEFNSFLWPDDALPTLDGDIGEWGIVPAETHGRGAKRRDLEEFVCLSFQAPRGFLRRHPAL